MRIFVTGTTGYIGAPLAQRLIAEGHTVVGLARSEEAAATLAERGISVQRGDVSQPHSVTPILSEVDAVIHVAVGLPRGVTESDAVFVEALIDGLAGSGKLLVLTSGLGVYAGTSEAHVDETTVLAPQIEMQALRVKLENRVVAAAAQGIRTVVLRPAHVFGRGTSGMLFRTLLGNARETKTGAYIGDGLSPVSTVHIDDLIEAYLAAVAKGEAGRIYNLVSGQVYMKDLAQAVSLATGGTGEASSVTLEDAQRLWGPIAALYGAAPIVSGNRAIAELGWKATAPSVLYELIQGSLNAAKGAASS